MVELSVEIWVVRQILSYFPQAQLRQKGELQDHFLFFNRSGQSPSHPCWKADSSAMQTTFGIIAEVYELDKEITSCPLPLPLSSPQWQVASQSRSPRPGDIIADADTQMWKYIKLAVPQRSRLLKDNLPPARPLR